MAFFFFWALCANEVVYIQLLTYRPDDGLPSEDTEPSHEEREMLPSDDVVLVSEETEPSPPPPPSADTQNIIDTDDLLVKNPIMITLCLLISFLLPIAILMSLVLFVPFFPTGFEHCCS